MMNTANFLQTCRDLVQHDIGGRGLARDPHDNLLTATLHDFAQAVTSITEQRQPRVGIVTGFMIPSATPPVGETDGPLGALFLAQTLHALHIPCVLASDAAGVAALRAGVAWLGLATVPVLELTADITATRFAQEAGPLTHLIALERSGPSHADGEHYTMRGRNITPLTAPAQVLFEGERSYTTIGIGDGGNEIGMGKIPQATIAKNIPHGDQVACRTATDWLLVAGISNWGAYALAAGLCGMRGQYGPHTPAFFAAEREQQLLAHLVATAPLVDGVTGQFTVSVDGLDFATYSQPLLALHALLTTTF